jgi:tetratricopeptide (TPR) repeat protein
MSKRKPPVKNYTPPPKQTPTPRRDTRPASASAVPAATPSNVTARYTIIGLLAALLGFVLYINTFGYDYTLDDFSIIKDNWVTKGGLKNLNLIFTKEYRFGSWNSVGSLYRPLPLTMFAFEWQNWPDNAGPGHVINTLLYALTGWVLWITWRRILAGYPPILPALAVLIFMVHPLHTEVIANIKSRDEILALLGPTGALYGLWRYFESKNRAWIAAALLFFTIGQFSKEGALVFLAIIPLTVYFFAPRPVDEGFRLSVLFLLPVIVFWSIRAVVLAAQNGDEVYSVLDNFIVSARNPAERLASASMMCGLYLYKLFIPHPLVHELGFSQMRPVTFADWRALVSFFVYLGLIVWAIVQLPKRHFLSYAILFYMVSFSMFSNVFVLIGTSYGERLMYTPSFGFALAVAWLLHRAFRLEKTTDMWNLNGKGALVWGFAGALLVAYSLRTVYRNPAWENSYSLYTTDIVHDANSAKLNYHYGLELTRRGLDEKEGTVTDRALVEQGIARYTRALELYPGYHDAYGSRGLAYFRLQDYDKAFADYQEALKHRPNDAKVLSNMGFIYSLRNQLDKAEEVYRKAVQYDPRFVDARRNLGAVLAMRRQFPAAIEQWQEGLKYDPNNETLLRYIGSAYKDMGQPAEAQPWIERADAAASMQKK